MEGAQKSSEDVGTPSSIQIELQAAPGARPQTSIRSSNGDGLENDDRCSEAEPEPAAPFPVGQSARSDAMDERQTGPPGSADRPPCVDVLGSERPVVPDTGLCGGVRKRKKEVLEELASSEAHRRCLDDLRREEKMIRERMRRKGQNLAAVQSEIYQLLGLFFLFQGVVFTALAQSSILTCRLWWSPFALCLLVTAATLWAMHQKLGVRDAVADDLAWTGRDAGNLYQSIEALQNEGCTYDLSRGPGEGAPQPAAAAYDPASQPAASPEAGPAFYLVVVILSALVLASCPVILCRGCTCAGHVKQRD